MLINSFNLSKLKDIMECIKTDIEEFDIQGLYLYYSDNKLYFILHTEEEIEPFYLYILSYNTQQDKEGFIEFYALTELIELITSNSVDSVCIDKDFRRVSAFKNKQIVFDYYMW